MLENVFDKLGGPVVVAVLMDVHYKTAWGWQDKNHLPEGRRLEFIKVCKRHGVVVTLQELASENDSPVK